MARKAGRKSEQCESAVLVMSDLHYGKQTKSFGTGGFGDRLAAIGDRVATIRRLMSGYEFDELVVCVLGDVNDGTDIYATQAHHQAESNVEEQAEQLSELLVPFFRRQHEVWGKVRVACVPGNHGRAGRFSHEAASWDTVAYKYLRAKLKDGGPPIPVVMNGKGQNPFLRVEEVRNHRYLLYHGHDIKSFGNIPWYGMQLRVARWNTTKLAPFDAVLMGHYHSFGTWAFNSIELKMSGTMITDDEWALQTLGWESANKWWLFGVSNSRPVTWEFGIDVA